jgi:hypothetical protein
MNFMQPNPVQSQVARAIHLPDRVSNQISPPKRIAQFCFLFLCLICTIAWTAFLARVVWSLF